MSKDTLICGRSNCGKPAEVVTIETLATPYCADCYKERWDMQKQREPLYCPPLCVTVDVWLTRLCPQGPHEPHIGCWCPTVLCSGHFGQSALCSGHFPPAQPQQLTARPQESKPVWKVLPGLI